MESKRGRADVVGPVVGDCLANASEIQREWLIEPESGKRDVGLNVNVEHAGPYLVALVRKTAPKLVLYGLLSALNRVSR